MSHIKTSTIRNFAIIAHVDHGKSTLADRLMEKTGTIGQIHEDQFLDRNPISRERGITIKLAPVRMYYKGYILNLIDTPGHVDFSYEVERTLSCVEGAILLVDATQGIQAQTIAHAHKAIEQNLVIIPVVNKVDLPSADISKTQKEIVEFLGVHEDEILHISAKTGLNIDILLDRIILEVPSPKENVSLSELSRSLIFDSYYDQYRGVIAFVRMVNGEIKKGMKVKLYATQKEFEVMETGIFSPDLKETESLKAGEIGYITTNLKDIHDVQVGDTLYNTKYQISKIKDESWIQLPGYKRVKPMVYASVFTTDPHEYINLKKALEKLTLNDSALIYDGIYSQALGSGFRVGFLGILHADVVRERLEREFNLDLVLTPPTVDFVKHESGGKKYSYQEPIARVSLVTPQEFVGAVMRLCEDARGTFVTMDNKTLTYLEYDIPLSELISHFFDRLKSVSSGYASFDWKLKGYKEVDADKMFLLLNGSPVDEFSEFVVQERAFERARELTQKLRDLIPRQQYEVRIQAQYKGKIIASERIAPFRKDVLVKSGKVIGAGDVGRKRKLLEKQKEGKKRMKSVGKVSIPKEAFLKLFRS